MADKYAVIGLGNFGFYVTKTLFEEGHDVTAIDLDEEAIQKVRPFCSQSILGDATQKDMVTTLGLEEMDAVVVSMGGNENAATLITLYLKEMDVERIVVKANTEDHGKILEKVGATQVIHPEREMAQKVGSTLSNPDILEFYSMPGDYIVAEIAPVEEFVGKSLAELQLRTEYNINVIGIKELVPGNFILVPSADFVIKDSDILIVIGLSENIRKLRELKEEK